jgi:hypothetical protein
MMLDFPIDQARDKFTNLRRTKIDVGAAHADFNRISGKSKKSLNTKLLHYGRIFWKEGLVGGDKRLKINITLERSLN